MRLIILIVGLCVAVTHAKPSLDASWWDRHAASISCARPGYFVNPVDCRSFYRCVDRSTWDKPSLHRYDFTCPRGLVFDPAVSVCTKAGPNGCADPWWPPGSSGRGGGGGNSPGGGDEFQTGSGSGSSSSNGGIDLDNLPPLFSSSRDPNRKSDVGNNAGYNRPSTGRPFGSSRPGFGFGGGAGADPLDSEFGGGARTGGDPLDSEFGGGAGAGGDPLDSEFGSPSGSKERGGSSPSFNRPSTSGGSSRPGFGFGGGSGADPLDSEFGGGAGGDPLDSEFGTPSDSKSGSKEGGSSSASIDAGFNRPSTSGGPFGGRRPGFGFGGGGGGDPLDAEFGTPSDGGSLEDLNPPNNAGGSSSGSPLEDDMNRLCLPSKCNGNGGGGSSGSGEGNKVPDWFNRPSKDRNNGPSSGSGENRGSSGFNRPSTDWNRKPPSSSGFDPWDSNRLGQGHKRPGFTGNWGGATHPGNEFSPWRPSGPFGSDSSPPPINGSNSWWDPPFALPFRPANPAPPPPPEPWANPFRPRYPVYQIVAYPTWPGPYDRSPVIVVYSNSKKKK